MKRNESLNKITITTLGLFLILEGTSVLYRVYGTPAQDINKSATIVPFPKQPPPAPTPLKTNNSFVVVAPKTLPYNPLHVLSEAAPFDLGTITFAGHYSIRDSQDKPHASSYLFINNVAEGLNDNELILKPTNFEGDYIFDPLISPNHRYIAFGYGWPYDSHGEYEVPIWDNQKEQIVSTIKKDAPGKGKFLAYRKIYWSPDSNKIAYIRGGDQDGNEYSSNFPISFYLHNVETGKDNYITSNPYLTHMAWTAQNTLLYGTIPEDEITDISPRHANIHEISADGTSSKVLINDGFDPSPSPDGKYIIYFGWPQDAPITNDKKADKKKTHSASQAQIGLYLFERATGKKTLLLSPVSHLTFLDMIWKPDSSGVIFLKFVAHSPHAQIQVSEIDKNKGKLKVINVLTVDDYSDIPRVKTEPQIRPLSITKDNKYLIFVKTAYNGEKDNELTGIISLDALNLIDGSIIQGAETTSFMGMDFLPTQ